MAVGVDKVIRAPLQATVPVIGRVVGREGGVISARTAGPVEDIRVHVGDRVKKGQLLAALVTARLRARVDLQEADLQLSRQELARLERLRTTNSAAFPKARYDDALLKVAKAKANLQIARLELSYAFIRAPYPGVITKRHTEAGAFLRQGDNVVSMINDRNLELEADVPVSRISGLTKGRKVRFELNGKQKYVASVRAVVPEQNSLTRTVAVRFSVTWKSTQIPPAINQNVTLHIPVGVAKTAISVHKDAVISRGPAKLVFVVVKKPKGPMIAVPRIVQLGEAVGSRFIVLRGLKPGDLVIIRGNERVRPGMPVRPLRRS
jgi:RND family efflux transporter MFP subunit